MRKRFLSSLAALAVGTGAALGQAPNPPVERVSMPTAPISMMQGAPVGGEPVSLTPTSPFPTAPAMMGQGLGMAAPPYLDGAVGPQFAPMDVDGLPYGGFDGTGAPKYVTGFPHFYADFEYLLWFLTPQTTNLPFLTSGSPLGAGVLGQPTTTLLANGGSNDVFSGTRITAGTWLGDSRRFGFQGSVFILEQRANVAGGSSGATGLPVIARPFTDTLTFTQQATLVAFPNFASGSADAILTTQVYGAEANALVNLYRGSPASPQSFALNLIAGYRYLEVYEDMYIRSLSRILNGNTAVFSGVRVIGPALIGITDDFKVNNTFHGGTIGLQGEYRRGRWTLNTIGKASFGQMNSRYTIEGSSELAVPPGNPNLAGSRVAGGLLANADNIGTYKSSEFTVIPELNVQLGYQVFRGVRFHVGYNLMYIPNVVRPLDNITQSVNSTLVPTSPAFGALGGLRVPQGVLITDDLWLQGLNLGFMISY